MNATKQFLKIWLLSVNFEKFTSINLWGTSQHFKRLTSSYRVLSTMWLRTALNECKKVRNVLRFTYMRAVAAHINYLIVPAHSA